MLTFQQIENCFPEGTIIQEPSGLLVTAQWIHDFARAIEAETKRQLLIDLWNALPGHEATGDTAGSLRAMLMLSEIGDEIRKGVANAE